MHHKKAPTVKARSTSKAKLPKGRAHMAKSKARSRRSPVARTNMQSSRKTDTPTSSTPAPSEMPTDMSGGGFNFALAMQQYRKRKAENDKKTRVDNSSLHAGSPMYFYCKFCGDPTCTLPEGYIGQPKKICDPCKILNDHGLIPERV